MGLTYEKKQEKITSELKILKNKIERESKNKEIFRINLERESITKLKKDKYDYILKDSTLKAYFYSEMDKFANEFEKMKNNILNEQKKKIENSLEAKYNDIKYSSDLTSFKGSYNDQKTILLNAYEEKYKNKHENKQLLEYENDIKDELSSFIDNWINNKGYIFLKDKKIKKSEIFNFVNENYDTISQISKNESEFKTNYENKIKNDLNLKDYYEIEEYTTYFNSLLDEKKTLFSFHLQKKEEKKNSEQSSIEKQFLSFFATNYNTISEMSQDTNQFKDNYLNKLNEKEYEQLKDKYNDFQEFYEKYLKIHLQNFERELEKKTESEVRNKFLNFIQTNFDEVSEDSPGLEEFKTNFRNRIDKNPELNNDYNKNKSLFEESLNKFTENFEKYLENKIQNKILKLLNEKYNDISKISSNEVELKNNFLELFDDDTLLKLKEKKYNDFFENELKPHLLKFKIDLAQRNENKKNNANNKFLSFLHLNYNAIAEKSSTEEEFKDNFVEELKKDSELESYYNEFKSTFDESLNKYILNFNNDLKRKDELKKLKIQTKIIQLFNNNYVTISQASNNEEEFKDKFLRKYNEDEELRNNYNDFKDFYDNTQRPRIDNFKIDLDQRNKNEQNDAKNKFLSFINSYYNGITEKSSNEKEFKDNFLEELNKNSELKSYHAKFKTLYEESLNPYIINFNNVVKDRVKNKKLNIQTKIIQLFNNNYRTISQISKNEEEFKSNFLSKYNEDEELRNNYNDFRDFYDNILNNQIETFKRDLTQRIENEENTIKNKFRNFFYDQFNEISEASSSEEEFKSKYKAKLETINELKNKYNEYKDYYELVLKDRCNAFLSLLKIRNEKEKIEKENAIKHFFEANFSEISSDSSTEEEFLNNFERKKQLETELLKNLDEYKNYYDKILNENINKFKNVLKDKIEKLFFQNFSLAIDLSTDEKDFKDKLKELLCKKEGINSLFQKEEYNTLYERLISENINKIKNDLEINETTKKNKEINDINEFIDSNYDKIYQQSNNKNEFINNMKNKASNKFKNETYFNTYLSRKAKDFEKDKKEEFEEMERQKKTNEYNQLLSELKNEYLEKIKSLKFEDEESIQRFKEFKQKSVEDTLTVLCKEEEYIKQINSKINLYIEELLNEENRKVKHLNILLCGNSGAGKSTLINAILELKNDNIAPTGTGHAITQETKYYNSKTVPFLRCADSRGTEIRKNGLESYGISEVMEEMNKFISKQIDSGNPDNYIHCIWYCILTLDSRFNETLDECLRELESAYKLNKLPVIIVGTKSVSKEFNETFANYLKKKDYKYEFIPILAQKVDNHEPFGLEELKLKSIQLAMGGVESSCYQGIIKNIIKTSNLKIEDKKKIIDQNIQSKKEEILKIIENDPKFETVKIEMKNIFIHILDQYVSINLSNKNNEENIQKELCEKSKIAIDELIKLFYDHCKNIYDQSYNKFFESKVIEFLSEMSERKEEFLESTKIHIETKTKGQMKRDIEKNIKDELKIKADIYYLHNVFKEFVNLLIKAFPSFFIRFYEKLIEKKENDKKIKELIISKIKVQFEDLKKEIEDNFKKAKEKDNLANGTAV